MKSMASWAALAALALTGTAYADTLLIDRVENAADQPRPTMGLSMDQVRSRFGEPIAQFAPVGGGKPQHPPITRWQYDGYTVYFERDKVIYSVPDKATVYEEGPKPVD
jgi:hypothetical protein